MTLTSLAYIRFMYILRYMWTDGAEQFAYTKVYEGTDQPAYTKDTCVQWYRPGCIYAENGSLHIPRYMWLVMVQASLCITGYMQTDGTDKPANYTQE